MKTQERPYFGELSKRLAARFAAEAEARGEARGESKALLRVLTARDMPVDEEARERIVSCTDTNQLNSWLDRAVHVSSTDELFA